MTDKTSPDLLDVAEAVAHGDIQAGDAERQVRAAGSGPGADTAVRELHGLIAAARAVRSHVQATRDAAAAEGISLEHANAAIATVVAGPVRTGPARRHPSNGGAGQPRRRTWLLAVAVLVVGTSVIGATLVAGRLADLTTKPTFPNQFADATTRPAATPNVTVAPAPVPAMFAYIETTDYPWHRLWVANIDGTGAHAVAVGLGGNQQAPVWSPDGTQLLFSRAPATIGGDGYPDGVFQFYLADAGGGEPRLVDTGCVQPCLGDSDPAYSPDGTQIVFVRTIRVPPPASATPAMDGKLPGPGQNSFLATMDLATRRVVELTSTTVDDVDIIHRPRFSPDGSQIAFDRRLPIDVNEPIINGDPYPGPLQGLVLVDADGRNLHRIVPSGMPMDWPSPGSPEWSPDGAHLVFEVGFASNPVPAAGKGNGYTISPTVDVYTIRPDGTDTRRLTSDGGGLDPSWTADGRILFARWAPDQFNPLWIMDADGSNARQLSFPQQLLKLGASPNQPAITALTTP